MGGSRPPHGGLCEEDQDHWANHSCQEDQDHWANHSYQNIVSVPIEFVSASITIPIKSVCDSIPVESVLIKSVENSFPYNMISNSAYSLALNIFIYEIGKETLNNKELK